MGKFALLVDVHSLHRTYETHFSAVTYFHEYKARIIKHDEVYLAAAGTEVAADRLQAFVPQILKRRLLGVETGLSCYSRCSGSYHDSASIASGGKSSASSLISWIGPPAGSASGNETGVPR